MWTPATRTPVTASSFQTPVYRPPVNEQKLLLLPTPHYPTQEELKVGVWQKPLRGTRVMSNLPVPLEEYPQVEEYPEGEENGYGEGFNVADATAEVYEHADDEGTGEEGVHELISNAEHLEAAEALVGLVDNRSEFVDGAHGGQQELSLYDASELNDPAYNMRKLPRRNYAEFAESDV